MYMHFVYATGYASQHIWCLSQARINWEGYARKGIWLKNVGDGRGGAPISLDGVAVHLDCWCVCLCYLYFSKENPEDGEMYFLAPAHPGCPGQTPESCKMAVVCLCVCMLWCCWLGGRKGTGLWKNWVVGCRRGYLGWGADLHMAQQMPLPLTISCSSKSRLVLPSWFLPFWYLLTRVVPDKFQKSSKMVVCVCVCV